DGSCCNPQQVSKSGLCCPAGKKPDPTGKQDCLDTCNGTLINGQCCPPGQATAPGPRQMCCPAGQKPDDKYHTTCVSSTPLNAVPVPAMPSCPADYSALPDGSCCRSSSMTKTGKCCGDGSWVSGDGNSCETLREKKKGGHPVPV